MGIALEWLMSILQGHPWETPADGFWQALSQQRAYSMAHDANMVAGAPVRPYEAITWQFVRSTAYRTRLPYRRSWAEDSSQLVAQLEEAANDGSGVMLVVFVHDPRLGDALISHAVAVAAGPDGVLRFCDPSDSQASWPASSRPTDAAAEVTQYIEQRTRRAGFLIRNVMLYKFGGRDQTNQERAYYDSAANFMPLEAAPRYRASP